MKKKQMRKNHKAEVRIPFPVALTYILIFAAVFGISYVWLCTRCNQLGQDIKELETAQRAVNARWINEQDRWASMRTPANFERTLRRHGLHMHLPDTRQIILVRNADERLSLAYNSRDGRKL
ncbi:MAG: hypothetical protein WC959_09815 [Kiritimatiellales bacterium]